MRLYKQQQLRMAYDYGHQISAPLASLHTHHAGNACRHGHTHRGKDGAAPNSSTRTQSPSPTTQQSLCTSTQPAEQVCVEAQTYDRPLLQCSQNSKSVSADPPQVCGLQSLQRLSRAVMCCVHSKVLCSRQRQKGHWQEGRVLVSSALCWSWVMSWGGLPAKAWLFVHMPSTCRCFLFFSCF